MAVKANPLITRMEHLINHPLQRLISSSWPNGFNLICCLLDPHQFQAQISSSCTSSPLNRHSYCNFLQIPSYTASVLVYKSYRFKGIGSTHQLEEVSRCVDHLSLQIQRNRKTLTFHTSIGNVQTSNMWLLRLYFYLFFTELYALLREC